MQAAAEAEPRLPVRAEPRLPGNVEAAENQRRRNGRGEGADAMGSGVHARQPSRAERVPPVELTEQADQAGLTAVRNRVGSRNLQGAGRAASRQRAEAWNQCTECRREQRHNVGAGGQTPPYGFGWHHHGCTGSGSGFAASDA